jgi:hypothetical protein
MKVPALVAAIQAQEGGLIEGRGRSGVLWQQGQKRAEWRPNKVTPGMQIRLYDLSSDKSTD